MKLNVVRGAAPQQIRLLKRLFRKKREKNREEEIKNVDWNLTTLCAVKCGERRDYSEGSRA
jgi:hypothetical protein